MLIAHNIVYRTVVVLLVGASIAACSSRGVEDVFATLPASAEETTPLKSGDRAPAFTVFTVANEPFYFDPENLARPTILISFRGGWCPYCNMHLSELHTVIPKLRERGFDILFLSNDQPELLYASLDMETQERIDGLDYVILSDANLNAAVALGTAFKTGKKLTDALDRKNRDYQGSSIGLHSALAVPAVFVIDQSGTIVFDFVNADYKIRLPAESLLATANELVNETGAKSQ